MKNGRRETRDLGITLAVAGGLLFVVGYLTQCSAAPPRTPPVEAAATLSRPSSPSAEEQRRDTEEERRSSRGSANEQEDEERAKLRNVAHALQTIAASPELRATVGLPR